MHARVRWSLDVYLGNAGHTDILGLCADEHEEGQIKGRAPCGFSVGFLSS